MPLHYSVKERDCNPRGGEMGRMMTGLWLLLTSSPSQANHEVYNTWTFPLLCAAHIALPIRTDERAMLCTCTVPHNWRGKLRGGGWDYWLNLDQRELKWKTGGNLSMFLCWRARRGSWQLKRGLFAVTPRVPMNSSTIRLAGDRRKLEFLFAL
jgi:hypothetical protein